MILRRIVHEPEGKAGFPHWLADTMEAPLGSCKTIVLTVVGVFEVTANLREWANGLDRLTRAERTAGMDYWA